MKPGARAYLGIAIVTAATVLAGLGERGLLLTTGVLGRLSGVFVAVAAFALFAYRERRDPTLLLVGVGAAALAIHDVLLTILLLGFAPTIGDRLIALVGFSPVTGLLAVGGNLLVVVPWQDRRGRPPLAPGRVVAATAIGVAAFDVLLLLSRADPVNTYAGALRGLGVVGVLSAGALVIGGSITTVRSLEWGGRFGWVAAAGLALAIVGLGLLVSTLVDGDRALQIVSGWTGNGPGLIGAMLVVFVLASLKIESSHLRRTTDRAAEVMEGRAEIASTIAHDVRGPVGTIKGLATTTRKSYDRLDDPQRLEFIGMIEEEAGRLLRLTDQVAVGLKVDAGSLDLARSVQEVGPLVARAVEEVRTGERTIEVDSPADVKAAVDPRWFVEALRQGLDNALGFSPADQPVSIVVRKAPDDGALVTITDHGPGVPPERRDAVFEKFSRWRPAGYEDRQGSGLGLFICRGIARAHGGDASLDVGPAGGSMLRIRFPREVTA